MAAVETPENPPAELDEDALLADFDATLTKKKKKKKKKVKKIDVNNRVHVEHISILYALPNVYILMVSLSLLIYIYRLKVKQKKVEM